MTVFHLSMECYPVAKVGGLADVVGALPKYQNKMGLDAKVMMPWYNNSFFNNCEFDLVFDGLIHQSAKMYHVQIYKEKDQILGFDLFLIKIPGLLDRENVYGYPDESQQFIAFQHAVLHWLCTMEIKPNLFHCHDYHTGLIPFMINNCPEFSFLKGIKTIGTIHNGEYQGQMNWSQAQFLPYFDNQNSGLLDWAGYINPMAAMIKCCTAFNTVSEGYLHELYHKFQGLEALLKQEHQKAFGIINGIDTDVWDTQNDPMLTFNYNKNTAVEGKSKNKQDLAKAYHLNPDLPLIGFIGRFAGEKGADLLPEVIIRSITETQGQLNIIVLGSGNVTLEHQLKNIEKTFFHNFGLDLGYKEYLSHQIYAASDFLLMPSRVEPCGLNQMYAMRYGTIPVVRYTGGLRDTVQDITTGGSGLNFREATADNVVNAIKRAVNLYQDKNMMQQLIASNMEFDFSWQRSAQKYLNLYEY